MAIAKEIHKHFIDIKVNSDIFAYDFDGKSENQSWLTAIWSLLSVAMARCCGQDIYALRKKCPFWAFKRAHSVFLVEIKDKEWPKQIDRLMKGDFRIETRMMLNAELVRNDIVNGRWDVINEIVISRGSDVRPIEVRVDLNEGYLASYKADGLIVSTATGSTAYAFSAGGPILPPELRNMLILPISPPHLSLDRGVVLAEGATVTLRKRVRVTLS